MHLCVLTIACVVCYGLGRRSRGSSELIARAPLLEPEIHHATKPYSGEWAAAHASNVSSIESNDQTNRHPKSSRSGVSDQFLLDYTLSELTADAAFLTSLGLSAEQSESLKKSLYSIHKNSNQTTEAILSLSKSRVEHDAMMKLFLNKDDYERYKLHEKQKEYAVEISEVLQPFLQNSKQVLGDHETIVLNAIMGSEAITLNFSDGPYNGIPA